MATSVLIGSARPSDHGPLESALRRKGIRASIFTEGTRMLAAAQESAPDHVVVDLHLGGVSGFDLARALGEQRTSILVDEDEPDLDALRRNGLQIMVRPRGGAESLADQIERRLAGEQRLRADVEAVDPSDPEAVRTRMLAIVGGDEDALMRAALEDPTTHLLTGSYVRRRRLDEAWLHAAQSGLALGLMRIALDGLDAIARDPDALRRAELDVAGVLLTELDGCDLPARDAPGEFLVLAPGATAADLGRRAFQLVGEARTLRPNAELSVSVGIAHVPNAGGGAPPSIGSAEELVARAGDALDAARRTGDGRVCLWQGAQVLDEADYRARG